MMILSFWNTAILVWVRGFEIFEPQTTGLFTQIGALGIAAVLSFFLIITYKNSGSTKIKFGSIVAALAIWLFSGGAFWLVGTRTMPELHFSADRFTMPFMLGASLLLAIILNAIPNEKIRVRLFLAIVALAGAWQFTVGRSYAQDKTDHDRFFSQLIARVPGLQPGTALITNDLPFTYYSDNSLSGTLNWIYSEPGKMQTILYFASVRSAEGRALGGGFEPDQPIEQNYLARVFYGNTNDMLVFEYSPPGCLRLLDPEIDPLNKLLPSDLREAAKLSDPTRILPVKNSVVPPHVRIRENQWCDIYERASIDAAARNWPTVIEAFQNAELEGLKPQAPMEKLIFIEGYANTNDLDRAFDLSEEVRAYSKNFTTPPLCALWQRIEREANLSPADLEKIDAKMVQLGCGGN